MGELKCAFIGIEEKSSCHAQLDRKKNGWCQGIPELQTSSGLFPQGGEQLCGLGVFWLLGKPSDLCVSLSSSCS